MHVKGENSRDEHIIAEKRSIKMGCDAKVMHHKLSCFLREGCINKSTILKVTERHKGRNVM